jgi:hypothetical protein
MADRGEVRADLVRAPGFEPDVQERCTRQPFEHLEVGDGAAGAVRTG